MTEIFAHGADDEEDALYVSGREEDASYISAHAAPLAACAWEGFQHVGRGFVLVGHADPDPGPDSMAYAPPPLVYMPVGVLRAEDPNRAICQRYDPDTDVVVALVHVQRYDEDTGAFVPIDPRVLFYTMTAYEWPPRQAAEALRPMSQT